MHEQNQFSELRSMFDQQCPKTKVGVAIHAIVVPPAVWQQW